MEGHRPAPAFYIKRIIGLLLLLALSAVFLFSAWSKQQALEPFEWSFLELAPIGMTAAAVAARLFIGLEALIGVFLLAHLYLRKFTYRATLALLGLLTLYLVFLLVQQGNTGSCGCFGDWIYMKPLDAIWKNLAMIGATVALFYLYPVKPYPRQLYPAALLALAALAAPFVLSPVYISSPAKRVREPIDLNPVYTHGIPVPEQDLRQGRHIVAFLSTTCSHCKKAAYFLRILHQRHPELPVFMVLHGTEELEKVFLADTRSAGVPHVRMASSPIFGAMAGKYVPAVYWIRNSVIERKTYYDALTPAAIREWLATAD